MFLVDTNPRGDVNGLIAATALVHDHLLLVTRNVANLEDTSASVIDPCGSDLKSRKRISGCPFGSRAIARQKRYMVEY